MTDKYPLAALQGLRQLRQDKAMGQVRAWEKKAAPGQGPGETGHGEP